MNYKKLILGKLLDKYENSQGYKADGASNRKIYFQFSENNISDYYDEYDATKKKEVDISCEQLENEDFIKIHWGKGFSNHNILKVELREENTPSIYKYLGRKEKKNKEGKVLELLQENVKREDCLGEFSKFAFEMIESNKSIKKYLDIDDLNECKDIIKGVKEVLAQNYEIFRRTFSIRVYGNSKRYEAIEGKVIKIIGDFSKEWTIEEYNILKNYTYVHFKGDIEMKMENSTIDVLDFKGGIALSSEDIENIKGIKVRSNKLVTIENLTSFNNYKEANGTIYLGGYHNTVRQKLLLKIYEINREIEYYHCGDIDVGGFKILNHLRRKTGIPFIPLNMDIDILMNNIDYGNELKLYDKKEIEKMLRDENFKEYHEVLQFMIENNIKLEQEIVF
ncbi:MAG: Wadjet anti-phage system protein JetD domain-containing protein [Clostridium sp.]|uniref:Wadjet anti-phage system protein JetD domain-containing protein n=1 Tax=Clostridium sp. TaxID=1506 RepID=UPI003F2BE23C